MSYYADIHCHSTLRPYAFYVVDHENPEASIWFSDKPKRKQRKSILFPEYTQSDFATINSSNTKLVFLSLYPFEQGWFKAKPPLKDGEIIDMLVNLLTRLPQKTINRIQDDANYSYYNELIREYTYLNACSRNYKNYSFELVNKGDRLKESNDKLKIILTIEGAHSFIRGNAKYAMRLNNIGDVLKNIDEVKDWEFPPFFVSLCHHYYNGLAGHARSIFCDAKLGKKIMKLLSQEENIDTGINTNGWKVIRHLLSLDNESVDKRRIHIDIKHMSVAARIQYYSFIEEYNSTVNEDMTIPIIVSHAGYSGWATLEDSFVEPDSNEKYAKSRSDLNVCSINLADDEVRVINKSKGLIGLNMDKRILSGTRVCKNAPGLKNMNGVRKYWGEQIFKNITGLAKAVLDYDKSTDNEKKSIWDCISIGSDFDGMVHATDAFVTSNDFPALEKRLLNEFESWTDFSKYCFGYNPEDIVRKILYQNAFDFAVKYYK